MGSDTTWQAIGQGGEGASDIGESPFWQANEGDNAGAGRLHWVDIAGRAALRADLATGRVERWPLPAEPGCMAPAITACSIRMPFWVFSFSISGVTSRIGATRSWSPWTNRPDDGQGARKE